MIQYRVAEIGDEVGIHGLIRELAEYERAPDSVINTVESLRRDLFTDPICEAFVATSEESIVGFALYYVSYSTWRGRCIYLEDLYVKPEYRRHNIGNELFELVRNEAVKRGYKRMDWQVLDWNEPAIAFYKKQGAELDPEWINGRLYFD